SARRRFRGRWRRSGDAGRERVGADEASATSTSTSTSTTLIDARTLTYQARQDGDLAVAQAYPVSRAALARIFEDWLLRPRGVVRPPGRARVLARLLEGQSYHPRIARAAVALDGEEFVRLATRVGRPSDDRAERHATFEFFDASLRSKLKDASPEAPLAAATE